MYYIDQIEEDSVTDLEIAADLRSAADYLRTHGWTTGTYGLNGGARCLVGALVGPRLSTARLVEILPDLRALGLERAAWVSDAAATAWNDEPGRTLEEVLDRLESTATLLEIRAYASDQSSDVAHEVIKESVEELAVV